MASTATLHVGGKFAAAASQLIAQFLLDRCGFCKLVANEIVCVSLCHLLLLQKADRWPKIVGNINILQIVLACSQRVTWLQWLQMASNKLAMAKSANLISSKSESESIKQWRPD